MHFRSHTENPIFTHQRCLIIDPELRDLHAVCIWNGKQFVYDNGESLNIEKYGWIPEQELMQGIAYKEPVAMY